MPNAPTQPGHLVQRDALTDRVAVFADRTDAGRVLAEMLAALELERPELFAIPAGGIPVAVEIARQLHWPLWIAPVSKILLPWNSEAGYGAVAFDGSVQVNEPLRRRLGISEPQFQLGVREAEQKVRRRVHLFGRRALDSGQPHRHDATAILIDDGLASGFTMKTAVDAIRRTVTDRLIVAVPTAHRESLEDLLPNVPLILCPNVRSGFSFAVADAYRQWSDVSDDQAINLLPPEP